MTISSRLNNRYHSCRQLFLPEGNIPPGKRDSPMASCVERQRRRRTPTTSLKQTAMRRQGLQRELHSIQDSSSLPSLYERLQDGPVSPHEGQHPVYALLQITFQRVLSSRPDDRCCCHPAKTTRLRRVQECRGPTVILLSTCRSHVA